MKIAFITPTSLIQQYGSQGDFHLALSHLVDLFRENKYEFELKQTRQAIILDNGLFENGQPEQLNDLITKAIKIKASKVFAPDVLFESGKTLENIKPTHKHLIHLDKKNATKLAAVVQADNVEDFIKQYQQFVEMPEVSLIGLSILSIPKSFAQITGTTDITINRIECLRQLSKLGKHKDSHLLGAGSSYQDVLFAAQNCPWVVSHDSSSAVWNGIHRKSINQTTLRVDGGKCQIPVDFDWKQPLDSEQRQIIQNNINIIKKISKSK